MLGPVFAAEQRCGRENEDADATASCSLTVLSLSSPREFELSHHADHSPR